LPAFGFLVRDRGFFLFINRRASCFQSFVDMSMAKGRVSHTQQCAQAANGGESKHGVRDKSASRRGRTQPSPRDRPSACLL
jgi:hypothetical protein